MTAAYGFSEPASDDTYHHYRCSLCCCRWPLLLFQLFYHVVWSLTVSGEHRWLVRDTRMAQLLGDPQKSTQTGSTLFETLELSFVNGIELTCMWRRRGIRYRRYSPDWLDLPG